VDIRKEAYWFREPGTRGGAVQFLYSSLLVHVHGLLCDIVCLREGFSSYNPAYTVLRTSSLPSSRNSLTMFFLSLSLNARPIFTVGKPLIFKRSVENLLPRRLNENYNIPDRM
jgi:hypothetical protein